MKLHSPGRGANTEGMMGFMITTRKQQGTGRELQSTLRMSGMGRKESWSPPEKRIIFRFW
jgi:hypothetical protein